MPDSSPRILVTGATGYIGGRLVPRLLEKGYFVRCLARNPENLKGRNWKNFEVIKGDLFSEESLKKAMKDIDVAYYLIHSMQAGEKDFEERDRQAAINFGKVAKEAGVQRIIYLGGLGSEESNLSPHLQSRHEVGDLLRSSGVAVTEFRAAIIIGSGSISFEMIRYLSERLPIIIAPRWAKSLCQPIAIRDVLYYLIYSLEVPESIGKILEIGGSDVLTYGEMMLGYAKVRGLKRYLIRVPVLTPRLSSYWIDFVTPIPASISHPLIEGLKNDVICKDSTARKIFPTIQPISYLQAVEFALQRIQKAEVETIWSTSSSLIKKKNFLPLNLETREGMIIETRQTEIEASPEKVFKVFSSIGGNQGWFYLNWTWKFRGFLDRLVGGIGMRRGRRNPNNLIIGDALDFWRVEEVQKNHLIRLRAEMKLPGRAWLQFEVMAEKNPDRSHFIQTAFFEPKGLFGFFYWYLLYPIHKIIFSGLCRRIKEKSETM